jgi:transcription initiation factor IIF auxiliary subunit
MDASDVQDLKEQAEHGAHEASMRPVAFTMSVLAVLVAVTTVMGERTHTEAVLNQNKATDQWNYYQAHKIRANDTELTEDLLNVVALENKDAAAKLAKSYADHEKKWAQELNQEQAQAQALDASVEHGEAKTDRYDLGEVLLEIGLVVTSVTLLTKSRFYWYVGVAFAVGGIVAAASGFLLK